MRAVPVLIIATILVAGCVSVERTRASEPVAEGVFPGQWREFAECVNFQLGDQVFYNPSAEKAAIRPPRGEFFYGLDAAYELSIQQAGPDNVVVQLRHQMTLHSQAFVDRYWPPVEICGAE